MLQQTPVARVAPVWHEWLARWPTPTDLAADAPGEAVRAWGRLGYPRRALRLHAAAVAMTEHQAGTVPSTETELLALPGVGTYTAAAVATFAFGERTTVVDTNVRRVLARVISGEEYAAPSPTRAELTVAAGLVPLDAVEARTWSVAVMELGALVCSARSPRCSECPVADLCAWQLAGRPSYQGPARKGQAWEGTDRQLRGALLAVLRASDVPVPRSSLEALSDNEIQRERCLDSLVADGLVEPLSRDRYQLPASREAS
ncbi:A/G-specific adenine glycosylase [Pedococcus bigeumensis]|uniref:A/G-specific adenine glycosylase n=2 Tax=Pedococcus bigeumensis TaxID=433644 RepID=A0A502CQW4_9MICO|nr:A/G-specific adenine glycosylase [Pedococcus bigeumensis]